MTEKENTYKKAFREIISDIIAYTTTSSYYQEDGSIKNHGSLYGFFNEGYRSDGPERKAKVGDLIRIGSARTSEWYLSWYVEERRHYYKDEHGNVEEDRYESEHLLKSIETGKLCWWSNISISYFNRERLAETPSWKWNDRQFEFKDKWWKVCFHDKDAYITLPLYPEFGNNYEVTIGTRTRFSMDTYSPTKTFPDYRKLTKKMLGDFYDECVNSRPVKEAQKND